MNRQSEILSLAARLDSTEILAVLLETIQTQGGGLDWSQDLRQAVNEAAGWQNKAALEMLIRVGKADVNAQNSEGRTPLHECVLRGNQTAVKLLLDHGARQDIRDSQGKTAAELGQQATLEDWMKVKQPDL